MSSELSKLLAEIEDLQDDLLLDRERFPTLLKVSEVLVGLSEALDSARSTMVFHNRDYSQNRRDFWLYGILVGWGEVAHQEGKKLNLDKTEVDRMQEYNHFVSKFMFLKQ